MQVVFKKYQAGHKYHSNAFDKAQSALKKQKKKNKNKYGGFDQKELQVNAHKHEHDRWRQCCDVNVPV